MTKIQAPAERMRALGIGPCRRCKQNEEIEIDQARHDLGPATGLFATPNPRYGNEESIGVVAGLTSAKCPRCGYRVTGGSTAAALVEWNRLGIEQVLDSVVSRIQAVRFNYSDESDLQAAIADLLGPQWTREYRLGNGGMGRVDFYSVGMRAAVEVKSGRRWGPDAVARQCLAYLERPEVEGLVLAATSRRILVGVEELLRGIPAVMDAVAKPVRYAFVANVAGIES